MSEFTVIPGYINAYAKSFQLCNHGFEYCLDTSFYRRTGSPATYELDVSSDGCNVDGATVNCTQACSDPANMFASLNTVANCVSLASAAIVAPNATIRWAGDPGEFSEITSLADFDVNTTFNNIRTCVLAARPNSTLATCTLNDITSTLSDPVNAPSNCFLSDAAKDLCSNVVTTANTDIAGPGVFISYVIQSVIAIFAWAIITASVLGIQALQINNRATSMLFIWCFRHPVQTTRMSQVADLNKSREALIKQVQESKLLVSMRSALVEFQEAQCFFTLAVKIAVFYSMKINRAVAGETTFSSVRLNHELNYMSANIVLMALSLTQLTLFATSMRSAYVFWLYTSTIVVCMCLGALTPGLGSPDDYPQLRQNQDLKLAECGGHTSPLVFCGGNRIHDGVLTDGYTINLPSYEAATWMAFSWVWLMVFAVWYSKGSYAPGDQKVHMTGRIDAKDLLPILRDWVFHQFPAIRRVLPVLLGLLYLAVAFILLNVLIDAISFVHAHVQSSAWSLGQIIALTVWVPVISKFAYMLVFGIEKTSDVRVPAPYSISIKRQDPAASFIGGQNLNAANDQGTPNHTTGEGAEAHLLRAGQNQTF